MLIACLHSGFYLVITNPQSAHVVHYLLEWTALAIGLLLYRRIRRQNGGAPLTAPGSFAVVVGCLVGAAIGNKLAYWINNPRPWLDLMAHPGAWIQGQSFVGALLGGWLGVEIGKRISGLTARTGDDFVVPILAGLVIGRAGCFLAGLTDGTCGLPTPLPWGLDFGDGVSRHPVQLYESLLALMVLATRPLWRARLAKVPGLAFRVLVLGYLAWRVLIDFLKPVPHAYAGGLSGIQWICIVAAWVVILGLLKDLFRSTSRE